MIGDTFMYKIYENDVKYAKVTKIERDCVKKQWTFCFDLYNSKEDSNVECEVGFFRMYIKKSGRETNPVNFPNPVSIRSYRIPKKITGFQKIN